MAAATLGLALPGGSYGVEARSAAALVALAATIATLAVRGAPPLARSARTALAALAGLGLWTAMSIAWAPNPEAAFLEADRVALYLAVLALVVAATSAGRDHGAWLDGVGLGIAAVGVLALAQRCLPGLFPADATPLVFPGGGQRLSYPLNYYNGLAIELALGVPLLLRTALRAPRALPAAAALAALVPCLAGLYLTSSRGGAAAAALGVIVLALLARLRPALLAAAVIALAGGLAAVIALRARPALVGGPRCCGQPSGAGVAAFATVVLIAAAVGLAWAAVRERVAASCAPGAAVRIALPATLAAIAAAAAVAGATGAFRRFAEAPSGSAASSPGAIASHLLSANGSGRAQLWSAALRQFTGAPVGGGGAGSYEVWWARHASIPMFVRNPHSLYLQELGELGVPGLLLILVPLGAVLVPLARRLPGDSPVGLEHAAAGAVVAAWALAAAYDWVWQLPAISGIGVAALGLAATAPPAAGESAAAGERPRFRLGGRLGSALRPAALAVCVLLVLAELIPWLASRRVEASRAALGRADVATSLTAAYDATTIEPWSSSAYEQLAAAATGAGRLGLARSAIDAALRRDPYDWQAWLQRAHIALARGDVAEARAALRRARNLAPRLTLNL